jgi:hypothetical protein
MMRSSAKTAIRWTLVVLLVTSYALGSYAASSWHAVEREGFAYRASEHAAGLRHELKHAGMDEAQVNVLTDQLGRSAESISTYADGMFGALMASQRLGFFALIACILILALGWSAPKRSAAP